MNENPKQSSNSSNNNIYLGNNLLNLTKKWDNPIVNPNVSWSFTPFCKFIAVLALATWIWIVCSMTVLSRIYKGSTNRFSQPSTTISTTSRCYIYFITEFLQYQFHLFPIQNCSMIMVHDLIVINQIMMMMMMITWNKWHKDNNDCDGDNGSDDGAADHVGGECSFGNEEDSVTTNKNKDGFDFNEEWIIAGRDTTEKGVVLVLTMWMMIMMNMTIIWM